MKRAIILISIFMIGCQTFDHERMKEVFEQYDIDYTESSETKQDLYLSIIHISEQTRKTPLSYDL